MGLSQSSRARVRRSRLLLASFALVLCSGTLAAQTKALVVTGLGGEDKYHQLFMSLGGSLTTALRSRFALPDSNIAWLGEDSTSAGSGFYRCRSTAENIHRELARMPARPKPGRQRLNVPGGRG